MSARFERFGNYDANFEIAKLNAGPESQHLIWQEVYRNQGILTEIELGHLGVEYNTSPQAIPDINKVVNPNPINLNTELGLIEVIGPPGAGKDTAIAKISEMGLANVVCAPEEGYRWTQQESPLVELRKRHFQVYGGTDMEIDELMGALAFGKKEPHGVALLNRSIPDNFLAFGYSFFLSGRMGVADLIVSQKMFHFFQYSPTIRVGEKMDCVENITAATFILMVEPQATLERIPRRGRILEEDFLGLLYTQYLRMISRLRTMEQRNLVVLDMSGTKEENTRLFQEAFDKIVVK